MENRAHAFLRKLFLCQRGVRMPPFRNSGTKSSHWIEYSDGFDIFVNKQFFTTTLVKNRQRNCAASVIPAITT